MGINKELKHSGVLLDVFNDPTIALSNFKAGYYKLIRLDVKMPQMNGFELYQKKAQRQKHTSMFCHSHINCIINR